MMNKDYIIYNLVEAKEALDKIIHELQHDPEYEKEEYYVDMQHLFHHINTAWNSRHSTKQQSIDCSEQDFNTWRQFPQDIDMNAL